MSKMTDTYALMARTDRETAAVYRKHATQFEPGSLGSIGNNAEADKYDGQATRYEGLAGIKEMLS